MTRPRRAAARPHPLLAAAPALRRWAWCRCVGTSYKLVSRSREILELDQKAIQLDKARSLSQQVAVYVSSLRARSPPSPARWRWTAARGQFPERVARIREAEGLERYVERHQPLLLRERGGRRGLGRALRRAALGARHRAAPAGGLLRGLQGKSMVSHPVISTSLQEPVMVLAEPVKPRRERRSRAWCWWWPAWARSGT